MLMNPVYKKIFLLFLISISFSEIKFAQENTYSNIDWFAAGFGAGPNKNLSGIISYTFAGENIYQLSYNTNFDGSLFGKIPKVYVESFSFSYGKQFNNNFGIFSLYGGPSFVMFKERYKAYKYSPGLNLGSQIIYTPLRELGIGIDLFGNFNFHKSVQGMRLILFFRAVK